MEILTIALVGVIIGGQSAFIMKFLKENNELKMYNNRLQMSENQFRKEVARLKLLIPVEDNLSDVFNPIPKIKKVIAGKLYDTEKCECIGQKYDFGENFVFRASNGQLLFAGQLLGSNAYNLSKVDIDVLSNITMTKEQEKRCVELGIIEIIN